MCLHVGQLCVAGVRLWRVPPIHRQGRAMAGYDRTKPNPVCRGPWRGCELPLMMDLALVEHRFSAVS